MSLVKSLNRHSRHNPKPPKPHVQESLANPGHFTAGMLGAQVFASRCCTACLTGVRSGLARRKGICIKTWTPARTCDKPVEALVQRRHQVLCADEHRGAAIVVRVALYQRHLRVLDALPWALSLTPCRGRLASIW